MSNWTITPCIKVDLPAVVDLVNAAYRGADGGQAGWTSEASYIDGQRTSLEDLARELAGEPKPTLLILREILGGDILACAMVEPHVEAGYGYIGMVTVKPGLQAGGIGRAMLEAAEDHVRGLGVTRVQMTVVSIRDSLIAWYERRGYRLTSERKPFPYDDARFGVPRRPDLEFAVLEKRIA